VSLFLDASAITKLVVDEPESAALERVVAGKVLVTSRVAVVEVTRAVARADPAADPWGVLSRVAFVELDADLARLAGATGGPLLRALDAIHIASALRLVPEIEAFVTYDDRQADAARAAGLDVVVPMQ
jgi:predicted nucleic acid-binding protein